MMNVFQIMKKLKITGRLPPVILIQGALKVTHAFFKEWEALCACHSFSSCGTCEGCLLLQHDNHPDLLWVQAHQAGHSIKIEQIRDIQQQCMHTPQISTAIHVFIEGADALNAFSANALLKLLEEPQGKVFFLLSADNASLLPKTILSRCWRFEIQPGNPLTPEAALSSMDNSDTRMDILRQYPQLVAHIQDYLQHTKDIASLVRFFEAYTLDDILWSLQFYTLRVMEIIQSVEKNKAPEWIASITIPPPVWWQFWDALIQLRQQLRIQSSLQTNLQLTRLFLILHGLK
jgi:DNA polymerase III, delta subunit